MAKGENIFRRRDGRWEARYIKGRELSGKIKYGYCYGKTYREAKVKAAKHKAALENGALLPTATTQKLFSSYCLGWLHTKKCTVKESTYIKYSTVVNKHIMPVTKAIQHNPIGNDYLCFLIMLLLFPCVMRRCEGDVSFYRITIFFACGIITAALTAQQIATFPNISQFIKVDSYLTVTRLSGFYGDPNFYSAHIAACLAGTQLLLCHEKSRRRQIVLAILALVLLYCGLLSASKSFIIVTACLFLLWVPILLEKGTFSSHFRLFVGLLCAGIIIASSSAFRALLQIVDDRFAQASNLSELTTGRTDLWRNYIHEFLNNPITLLFGEGYTSINLNNKASHNTLIQVVYQFGLIGMPLLISWVVISLRNLFTQLNAGHVKWKHALLMCVGVVLPWMGIDILQFDEFFLLPVYAVIGIAYSTRSTENKKLESSKGEI